MPDTSPSELHRLRRRVERALSSGARGRDVLRDLDRLAREAGDGHDALFAHRQLAELRLESAPWVAALHLRRLITAKAADDGVFAMMGLCQAMLGNFRAAIASYRKAVELAPRNPWYHHNLGHLLDVGVGCARTALTHLRLSYGLEPKEHEIAASLAHCVARLGEIDEARALAKEALRRAPNNADHRALLGWIERGAPSAGGARRALGRACVRGPSSLQDETPDEAHERRKSAAQGGAHDPVLALLTERLPAAGFSQAQVDRALALWLDFARGARMRGQRPEAYAAAIEYAMAVVHASRGVTRAVVGRRYGVTPSSISSRYAEIRSTLGLTPADPRYCVQMRG